MLCIWSRGFLFLPCQTKSSFEGTFLTKSFPSWQHYGNKQSQLETAHWLYMKTLCGMYTTMCTNYANLSLVPQHVVSLPSARLMAAACEEIQPAALVQHPRQFPPPLAKRSGNKQNVDHKILNSSQWKQQAALWEVSSVKRTSNFLWLENSVNLQGLTEHKKLISVAATLLMKTLI